MTRHQAGGAFEDASEMLIAPAPVAASRVKRLVDVLGAAAALLLFAPLLLLIAVAIFVEDGGPVLFRQPRCGLGGKVFEILKFRTMHVHSADDLRQAVPGDPRVTRVGRLLRRLSFDELPQLINVLAGEMSLVGPRPHAVAHDLQWLRTIRGYEGRYRARPGLTGRAQVTGCRGLVTSLEAIEKRVAADNAYIDEWSLMSDLTLILRTAPLLFGDEAAV